MDLSGMQLPELRAKYDELAKENNEIANRMEEQQDVAPGALVRVTNNFKAMRKVEARIAQFEAIERAAATPGCIESGDAPGVMVRVDPFDNRSPVVERARKLIDSDRAADLLGSDGQEHLEKLVRSKDDNINGEVIAQRLVITEHPHYRNAFRQLISSPRPLLSNDEITALRELDAYDARAMNIGTDSAGGYGVPVLIDPTIILTAQGSSNPFFEISRVETITTDVWRGVSSAGVSWSFDPEATQVSDDTPTLAQPTVTTHKAQGFVPFSIEVGMDYPGFDREISKLLTEGYSELLVQKFTVGAGDGSNEPFGIVTALDANTNVELAVTTDGAFGAIDLYALWAALPERFRHNATWMSSVDLQNEVRQFGTSVNHGFTIGITGESVPRLFERRYVVNDYMAPFVGTTGAANLIIVGDFKNYLIAQRAGMRVELVNHLVGTNHRPTGERGLYAWARVGADSVNDLGFRMLQNQ